MKNEKSALGGLGVGMFGSDDNQQPAQDNSGVLQAAMPSPMGDHPDVITPSGAPSMSEPHLTTPTTPGPSADTTGTSIPAPVGNGGDDLLNLKQQALQHLSPLVAHLDQSPEEKFRTTMMMIQASDDQTLIKTAFEAAQKITDDKDRAQALLDIINEINYFTQHQS